ncbi:hypothetical protein HDU98_011626 [Podochytrium sp. JEL0797]|nr:hypothetical protein HDU98_011626 [Podochytrium sp. JEL0797]
MLWITILPLLALAFATHTSAATTPTRIVSVSGPLFIDELGRSRIFRGSNVVAKVFPYIPDISATASPLMSFNQKDVDILAAHGTTAIRLGVMWPGVEPTQGNYNQTYLNEMSQIVQMCSDAGIYVLLDFHQDILSEFFCGEGVPPYIIKTNPTASSGIVGFPVPLQPTPYKISSNATDSAAYAYQQLYSNTNDVRDHFVNYWTTVAKTFLPFKNIIGYDIINEPFFGDIFTNILLLDAEYANTNNLQPFYDVVSAAIRAVDVNAIIHFESVTLIQKTVGFTKVPGGASFSNTSVFNFHYYSDAQKQYDLKTTMGFRIDTANALNCGAFLSEFEMGYKNGTNLAFIAGAFESANEHFLSVTGWEYKDYVPLNGFVITGGNNGLVDTLTGSVRQDFAAAYSQPYAHAIAGTPTQMQFVNATRVFTLSFTWNGQTGTGGITEIRTNIALFYPGGYEVEVVSSSGGFVALADNGPFGSSIFVVPNNTSLPANGANVTLAVYPKGAGVPVLTLPAANKQSGVAEMGVRIGILVLVGLIL